MKRLLPPPSMQVPAELTDYRAVPGDSPGASREFKAGASTAALISGGLSDREGIGEGRLVRHPEEIMISLSKEPQFSAGDIYEIRAGVGKTDFEFDLYLIRGVTLYFRNALPLT